MLTYTKTGDDKYDCTADYIVTSDNGLTVVDLIDHIQENRRDDWGCVEVSDREGYSFGMMEYRYGRILTSSIPIQMLDHHVLTCTANGGWSFMAYRLTVD